MKIILRNLTAIAAVTAGLAITAQARADIIDFYLNQPECTGACTSAPALISDSLADEVIVDLTSATTATVTIEAPTGKDITGPAWINVNDDGSYANFTASSPEGITYTEGSEDHFGTFDLGTGSPGSDTAYTISLTAEDGFSWTDAADVLIPNTNYDPIYGHGFEAVTGGQDAGYYTATVPEPASLTLFGAALAGLAGLGVFRRRRRSA